MAWVWARFEASFLRVCNIQQACGKGTLKWGHLFSAAHLTLTARSG